MLPKAERSGFFGFGDASTRGVTGDDQRSPIPTYIWEAVRASRRGRAAERAAQPAPAGIWVVTPAHAQPWGFAVYHHGVELARGFPTAEAAYMWIGSFAAATQTIRSVFLQH